MLLGSGMELTFFIVTHMVLRFEFVTKLVLITHQCFGCGWAVLAQCEGFLLLCRQGMQLGQLTQIGQRDPPSHKTLRSAINPDIKPKKQTMWGGLSPKVVVA